MPDTLTAPPPTTAPEPTPHPPPPIPAGEKPPSDYLGDIGSDLADMDAGKPIPPAVPRDDKGKFKAPDKPTTAKPVEKPAEAAEKPVAEQSSESPKPIRAAELRTAYEGLKKKVTDELQPTIHRLEAKIKEYETKGTEDTAPVLAKIKTLEERNADLEKRMALIDYEQSNDYQTKYEKPYSEMWTRATNAFSQLTVKEQTGTDPETEQPIFNTRRATEADLIKLGSLPLSELDEAAQRMFGASAPRAIQYIERLRDLAEAKQTAIVEAKQKAGEWKSQQSLEVQGRQKANDDTWREINKTLEEKFPKAFQAEQGDSEDAASHTKGFALGNLLFVPTALTPEQIEALPASFRDTVKAKQPLTDLQKVQLHALARLKIANHDRKVAALKKAQARIAELEKELDEYEKSGPSAERAGAEPRAPTKSWDEEVADDFKAMDK